MRYLLTLILLLGTAQAAVAPCVPAGRFAFAPVPEVALVRGMPQTVQLGIYQIDPSNPWPAGDLNRSRNLEPDSSKPAKYWTSNWVTTIVDANTGEPLNQFSYVPWTGELSYSGAWAGDVEARIISLATPVQSQRFRIRALTPTVVYGDGALATNATHGWNAVVCGASFSACRKTFKGGLSDAAPLVIYMTPGTYAGQDWYLPTKPYIYMLGDPATRPVLVGDQLGGSEARMHYYANLDLRGTRIGMGHANPTGDNIMVVRNVRQCCETGQQNGISNPNTSTGTNRWEVYVHNFEGVMMGGTGNTTHQFYIEGRPNSMFDLNNVLIRGTRTSSAIKTTMQTLNVRHSKLCSYEDCGAAPTPDALYMHTPIDVPAYTDTVIYGNHFVLYRVKAKPMPGAVFFRMRQATYGSDIPAYPNLSWDPPRSSQYGKSPGGDWPKGPETYVADKFWADARKLPNDDATNPYLFKHYIGVNTFELVAGSESVVIVRDDGTGPGKAVYQFGPDMRLWTHIDSFERSTSFAWANTYVGFPAGYTPRYEMQTAQHVAEVQQPTCAAQPRTPCTKWPRSKPEEFPRIIDVDGPLPPWFQL